MEYPKLRPIEALPVREGMICLRDPAGLSDKVLMVSPPILFILGLFDGRHSILDIQAEYTRRFGDLLFSDQLRQIIERLDGCLFLENNRSQEARDRIVAEFRGSAIRPATHAGSAYEADADRLRVQLDGFYSAPGGPGQPPGDLPADPAHGALRGLIAPHIDPRRGGACYAWSYSELARSSRASTFLILGISHAPTRTRYALTAKDFTTPLGTLPVDREIVSRLAGRCRGDLFHDEFVHRSEHSIEFQVVFLQHLFAGRREVRIVPILCSSLPGDLPAGRSPMDDPEVRELVAALRELIAERGENICLIAGVDFSHVGRRFGQDVALSDALLAQVEAEDRALLERVLARDAEGFLQRIREKEDSTNVCGTPAVWTLLHLLGSGGSSRLLRYDQAREEPTQSVVTFASAAFLD